MGIIRLSSTNPKFGFIIFKNPATGLLVKENRLGHLFGYYSQDKDGNINENEYIVYFRDQHNRVSYQTKRDSSFDYIDVLRYASPRILLDINKQFFRSTMNRDQAVVFDQDGVYENCIVSEFTKIDFNLKRLSHFSLYFTDVQFNFRLLKGNIYQVTLTTKRSLHYLINLSDVLFMYITLLNSDYFVCSEDQTESLIKSMNIVKADYYIRYLIKNKTIYSSVVFDKFKPLLEKDQPIQLCYGNTQTQRLQHLQRLLSFSRSIVDIGCGEGSYAVPYSRKLKNTDHVYYAMDVDSGPLATLNQKVKTKCLENVKTFNSLESLFGEGGYQGEECDMIITEVVEHMDQEPGQQLLKEILGKFNWKSVIITTPNQEFNKYYLGLEGFRHDDHNWEATRPKFERYMSIVLDGDLNVKVEYLDIGDRVEGVPITQGCLITK